ncbi:uncharacterized protein LOC110969670 isoform X2 [Acanthochromis polyacanthus]|uniref:uncharacterized protein LOC110969670 isoform X2 n=1 Tax=Acanthochromis polyacanthus TaxID=80966 RepID=UPI002233EF61|nr:uncharacterized protein LOC110969670 isoform X2 [Acanthochromis polyacanthus]
MTTKKLLVETLNQLSPEDFEKFKLLTGEEEGVPVIWRSRLKAANTQDVVELMVETYSRECVEATTKVLMKMSRTDLVQRLSGIDSGTKEEVCPPLVQRVEMMTSVIELLLETLEDLCDEELKVFRRLLRNQRPHLYVWGDWMGTTDHQDTVFKTAQIYGQDSVLKTKEALEKMERMDLVEKLSDSSSGFKKKLSVDERRSALIQKVAAVAAVTHLLLETLNCLSVQELYEFRRVLRLISYEKNLQNISWTLSPSSDRTEIVDLMVQQFGHQSVELTREVFRRMNRTDLIQKLPETSSGQEEKHSVDEPAAASREAAVASVRQILQETLKHFSPREFNKFRILLQFTSFQKNLPEISQYQLVKADTTYEHSDLMVYMWGEQSVEVTREVLKDMNRTDLVQKLSEISSEPEEEVCPPLVQRVETIASVIELLLETLEDLSDEELMEFRELFWNQRPHLYMQWMKRTDHQGTAFGTVQTDGQESVLKTKEVLEKMERMDLVQKLSDSSSRFKKKQLDEHLSALIHKVATMAAVEELLLETLKSLSDQDHNKFRFFLQLTTFQKNLSQIPLSEMRHADRTTMVDLMMKTFGQQSVEVTREVFMDMNRTDLVQNLPESSSEFKDKLSVDERYPELIQKVETMASVIELLLETLEDLSDEELEEFKCITMSFIPLEDSFSDITWRRMEAADHQDTVFLTVQLYGQESVVKTKEALEKMKRMDLVEKLSDSSSGFKKKLSVDERRSALIQKVAAVAAVKHLLLETLNDLSVQELEEFRMLLQSISFENNLPDISPVWSRSSDRKEIAGLIVEQFGQQSVEVTRRVFRRMNRTDLIQKLPETSSGQKEKHSVDEPAAASREAAVESVRQILWKTLKHFSTKELNKFRILLQFTSFQINFPGIPQYRLVEADTTYKLTDLMEDVWGEQSVEVTREVLKDMNRTDLVQKLSEISSEPEEEVCPPLVQRVETMASVIELLLETLKDLSYKDLKKFRDLVWYHNHHFVCKWEWLETMDHQDTVFVTVQTFGQESVLETKEALEKMERMDLVQKLSDSSSGFRKKQLDEHLSALIHKVATMAAVKEMILETLKSLSERNFSKFRWFQQLTTFQVTLPQIPWNQVESADKTKIVDLMMAAFGQQSVEVTREVFMDMNRTDLVQNLPEISSEFKDKLSVDERYPELIQKVETMASVIELLLETLEDLSDEELEEFEYITMSFIQHEDSFSDIIFRRLKTADHQDIVLITAQTYNQESVVKTKEALEKMKRMDLVEKLSDRSSGFKKKLSVDERRSALIQKVAAVAAVKHLLLETLNDLNVQELEEFRRLLQSIFSPKNFLDISLMLSPSSDRTEIVDLMMKIFGQQSVEVTREVFRRMNRNDLIQKLPETSSGQKEKHSVDEPAAALREAAVAYVEQILWKTLKHFSTKEFNKFRILLQSTSFQKNLPGIPQYQLVEADTTYKLIDLMEDVWGEQSVEVTREVLKDMNRTDLVQKLSEISSEPEEEVCPPLVQRVETMVSVIELLLETLEDLSDEELKVFRKLLWCRKPHIYMQWDWMETTDHQHTVFITAQIYGQESVLKTKEALEKMERMDLVEKLSDSRSGFKKKQLDEHLSALIHKVATMAAVEELLLETLMGLNNRDLNKFRWFLQLTTFQKSLRKIPWGLMHHADRTKIVDLMMKTFGQQSVEVTREVFMDMNRTDLVQNLPESSSEFKDKLSVDDRYPELIQKVETMASVIELLLETLEDLSDEELMKFKHIIISFLQHDIHPSHIFWRTMEIADHQDIVIVTVQTYGQESVVKTKEALEKMERMDLVQKLSDSSSGFKKKLSVDERRSALIQKVAAVPAVQKLLLETLNDLNVQELEEFRRLLQSISFPKNFLGISWLWSPSSDRTEMVDLMMKAFGQQSVEVTREVFRHMNRTDLVQNLPETSSGQKEKHSVDEPAAASGEAAVASVRQILQETLKHFSTKEFNKFRILLQFTSFQKNLPGIPQDQMYDAGTSSEHSALMVDMWGEQSVEVTREVLKDMNRTDLVQKLSEISSEPEGASRSLELEGCGSVVQQDSSVWTKLEPEVNNADTDEAPTYSLQSEAGRFECSVSGLRWVCEENASFKYHFCSWGGHMERMESRQYMPAGALIDISVIAGKLNEVYLPHWICIEDNSKILDKFAVLHIDECGDVVEKVSEVTASHVKLTEPIFSLWGVLVKLGFPVKIECNVLMYYKPKEHFLKLHVFVIPVDPALQQTVDKKESSSGYEGIAKPRPDKHLKMQQGFSLTADIDTATITPEKITLRYDDQDPNFYEVYIKNPDRKFNMTLHPYSKKSEAVWTCEIRKDDHPNSGPVEAAESSTGSCSDAAVGAAGSLSGATGVSAVADEKLSVDEQLSAHLHKAATITSDRERIQKMLQHLNESELKEFKWTLEDSTFMFMLDLPCIPRCKLDKADMLDLVDLMIQTYSQRSVEVTKKVFKKINRNDLVQMLSDSSS